MFRNKIRTASNLTVKDWQLLIQAWVLLLVVDWGLRILPFPRMKSFAGAPRPVKGFLSPEGVVVEIQRVWRMIRIASRNHLYSMTCLRRSLAMQRLLNRRGIKTVLRFGVQKEAGQMQAHAWLEYNGEPIGEPETLTERYITLVNHLQAP
jgi:hypothetical protein